MGAVNQLDLTSDVTHLVVGELNTPKYKYVARERPDVKVVDCGWVEAVRQSWIEGGETDVRMLEERHKVPVFSGLKICFTGVEDVDERQRLQELVTANGAEYHADLTKLVTHLMAKKPEGKKYHYASTWRLHIVTPEWLRDSLERGMTLDEREYNHIIPQEDRGKNAWIRRTASGSCLGKRPRDDSEAITILDGEFGERRKLRRSASQKLGSQNLSIWDDIIGGGFGEKGQQRSEWDETPLNVVPIEDANVSHSNQKRQDSVAPGSNASGARTDAKLDNEKRPTAKSKGRCGLFRGRRFVLHGFDQKKTSVLREHLSSHDAEISSSISELSQPDPAHSFSTTYVVVPHSSPLSECPDIPEGKVTIVNEWWIERCLYCKDFVDPEANVTSRPFPCFPIAGFEQMTICSTAFGGVDLPHVSKLVDLMGATYDGSLTKKTSVLVCNSASTGIKVNHAIMWDIPAVSAEWLWDCVRTGQLQSFKRYRISAPKKVAKPLVPQSSETPDGYIGHGRDSKGRANVASRRTSTRMDSEVKGQARCGDKLADSESCEEVGIAGHLTGMSTIRSEESGSAHRDKNDASSHDGKPKRGTPLQDLGQEINSTNQDALSTPEVSLAGLGSEKGEDIGEKIAELLRHQQGQLLRDQPPMGDRGRRPRRGLLGRTASAVSSHASLTLALSGVSSTDEAGATPSLKILGGDNSNNTNTAADNDLELLSQERSHTITEVPLASQVVTYEDPEAQKQKERVMRKLRGLEGKGAPTPKAKKTRSIGVARDSAAVKRSTRQRTYR
ncbi:MAG: hypothetical protein M1839_001028 [Geoglossum umbratile]|nr:MAG: hypothetical protein M1839_001028 [Geoglossum umbratile]